MAIDEETGEIKDSNVLEELQSDIEVILQEKSASLVKYCKARDCFIDNVDQEIKKLQALKKAATNKQDNFKKYIKMCMQKLELPKMRDSKRNFIIEKIRVYFNR